MKQRVLVVLSLTFLVAGCDGDTPVETLTPTTPDTEISDAAHMGLEGFYFLPPMVPEPTTNGTFNPDVRPRVLVCRMDDTTGECGGTASDTVAEYTMTTGTDGSTISVSTTDEHYRVNWHTNNFDLSTSASYRIKVFLTVFEGAQELGFADVALGDNAGELKNLNQDTVIGLVDNQTLPIKFRIEQGAGCEGDLDCGQGTIDSDGGVVTTASGAAGVSFPEGAVLEPVTVTIRQLDPAQQPGGTCLPTGIRQDGACYDFDTEEEISTVTGGSDNFLEPVTVGICPSPNAVREERLTLHKYDPERFDTEGVVELPNAPESFLRCDNLTGPGYASAVSRSLFGKLAGLARRMVSPVAALVAPEDLHATDTGRGGLVDAFSRISWAESLTFETTGVPTDATPGEVVTGSLSALTAHNDTLPPTAATDAQFRFDYEDPAGTTSVWYDTTDSQGAIDLSWPLTQETGVHTLVISTRDEDPSIPALIDDPTPHDTLQLIVCASGLSCGLGTVDSTGGVVTNADSSAGVSFPEGAVLEPVTVTIQQLDPAQQPGGRCLPTGIRQDGACFDFDTEQEISDVTGGSQTFLDSVTVAICPSPNAVREERLTLHKYNPERPDNGVVELPNAPENFLECSNLSGPGYASLDGGAMDRLAYLAGRAFGPIASALGPEPLYATDTGRGGLVDAFTRFSWAESITLAASGVASTASPGELLTGTVTATTAHNHTLNPTAGTDAQLRFDYTDPSGDTDFWYDTTDANGQAPLSWQLTQDTGSHTLVISSRDIDPSLQGSPLIDDPTPLVQLDVHVSGADSAFVVDYIAAGNWHTCAVNSGEAFCWGNNASGQLGDGTSTGALIPTQVLKPSGVLFDAPITGWGDVSNGVDDFAHTCVVTEADPDPSIYCWGENGFGELGDGSSTDSSTPVLPVDSMYGNVSAGSRHTCSTHPALCWGLNASGQLGDSTTTSRDTPVAVTGPYADSLLAVSAGEQFTCGTVLGDLIVCWGANNYGQLGIGATGTPVLQPTLVTGSGYTAVAAGEFHACGLAGGDLFCWGRNDAGQVGNGTTSSAETSPTLVQDPASGAVTWTAVSAGALHTCALTDTGDIYCWGANSSGQLGTGSLGGSATPVLVTGGLSWQQVTAGGQHSCALTIDDGAYCWGGNDEGQLGDGTTSAHSAPGPVSPPSP